MIARPIAICLALCLSALVERAVADNCGGSLRYQIVSPLQLVSAEQYDPLALMAPDGGVRNLGDYALDRLESEAEKAFPGLVLPVRSESSTTVSSDRPDNQVWIRGNISRMTQTLVKMGDINNNFIITSTGGVEFLDLVTGEVYFSKINTVQRIFRVVGTVDESDLASISGHFARNVDDIFVDGLAAIRDEYTPGCVLANVLGTHGDLVILDRGSRGGVAERQQFRGDVCDLLVSAVQDNFCLATVVRGARPENGSRVARIGANQLAVRDGRATLMVTSAALPSGPLTSPHFAVSEDMVQQWVHDYLSEGGKLSMLPPAGSLLRQQTLAGATGSLAETVVRGSRELPDLLIRCRIARATLEEVIGPQGEAHCEFVVEPYLEIIDRRTGILQLSMSREERLSEVIGGSSSTMDRTAVFERVTKNSIFEITNAVKATFTPARIVGHVADVQDGSVEFAIDEGLVGMGTVLELRRPGDEVRSLDDTQSLGRIEDRIGVAKVTQVAGRSGRAQVVAAAEPVRRNDVLFASCSGRTGLATASVLQVGAVEVVDNGGGNGCGVDADFAARSLQSALMDTGQWAILPNADGLERYQAELASLEGGAFKVTDWAHESEAVPVDVTARAQLVFEPEQSEPDGTVILRERVLVALVAAEGDTIMSQSLSMTKRLKGSGKSNDVVMGLGPDARPDQFANMTKQLLKEVLRRGMKE